MPPTGVNGPYNDMSGAPVTSGSAVQEASDPYAKSYANPYTQYPGWQQEETPVSGSMYRKSNPQYQRDGAVEGLTDQEVAWYGRRASMHGPTRPNHVVTINDRAEQVQWSDQGPMSVDPTPTSDGTQPTEPSNDSGRWSVANYGRLLRAGVGYTFLRFWTENARDECGFTGDHISLSDNAVVLPVGGMRPNYERNKRNTYRIEPEPWDLNYVDLSVDPTQGASSPASPVVPPNVGGRSYRLG
jgi:hypothetical protein